MKLLTRTLSLLAIAFTTLFFAGCGGGDDPKKPEEIELGKLAKPWKIKTGANSVTLDGVDRTGDFTNFILTISGSFNADSPEGPYPYSVTGSRPTPSPWPGAPSNGGTWTFGGTPATDSGLIARDDGTAMTYTISGGELTLNFTFNGAGYPGSTKTAQVNGNWTFVFN